MKEISEDFVLVVKEGKEDLYHDELISMLESLDNAQKTVKEAYYLFINRNIDEINEGEEY